MRFLMLFTFFLFGFLANSAEYKGIVLDSDTKEPISFGGVIIVGTLNGTVTNDEGEFLIKSSVDEIQVICSSLGFITDTFTLKATINYSTLMLKPVPTNLNEVAVTPETYPKFLIQSAINKIRKSDSVSVYSNAFYRQMTNTSNEPTEFQEVVYRAESCKFGTSRIALEQGRYAVKDNAKFGFSNMFSYANNWIWGSVIYDYNNILNNDANFKFELLSFLSSDGRKIAEIKTSPKVAKSKKHNDSVIYFVDVDNFNIIECRNCYYPDSFININLPIARATQQKVSYQIRYKMLNDSVRAVEGVTVKISYNIAFGVVHSFPTEIASHILYSDFTLVKPNVGFSKDAISTNDRKMIDALKYDSTYWVNLSAFMATNEEAKLIKSFNKTNSFDARTKKKD